MSHAFQRAFCACSNLPASTTRLATICGTRRPIVNVPSFTQLGKWTPALNRRYSAKVSSSPQETESAKNKSHDSPTATPTKKQKMTLADFGTPLGYWANYTNGRDHWHTLTTWIAAGPPPISQYRFTFGKHKGKLLEEAPVSYFAKYLLPRSQEWPNLCPVLSDAMEDFLERHPDVKSQAGRAPTKPLKEGILKPAPPPKKRGRKTRESVK